MWDAYGRQGVPTADAARQAFSVEPVTQAFFADYRRAFDAAKNFYADRLRLPLFAGLNNERSEDGSVSIQAVHVRTPRSCSSASRL